MDELEIHQREQCEFRLISCKYCELLLPLNSLNDHQLDCGGKSIPCIHCDKLFPRKKMNIHLAVDHQINLSLPQHSNGFNEFTDLETIQKRREEVDRSRFGFHSDSNSAAAVADLTSDEALARALQASENAGGIHRSDIGAVADEDFELARVLMESKRDEERRSAMAVDQPVEWGGDDDNDSADYEEEPEDWDDGGATASSAHSVADSTPAVRSDPQPCSYCGTIFNGYESLIEHMNVCTAIDD